MKGLKISKDRLYNILYECLDWIFSDNSDVAFSANSLGISKKELKALGFSWVADAIDDD